MKTIEELKKLDSKKLADELAEAQMALFKTRFEVKNGQSKSSHSISNYQKQVARIETLMRDAKQQTNQKTTETDKE